ncbi:MAG TPA: VOC family protein [Bryobacteraceae bacterium]|jgi:PhnB protein
MTETVPFLTFDGNCREAMTFYQKCFQGELFLMPFSGAPGSFSHSEPPDRILHSTLKGKGSEILMAADIWSGQQHRTGNNMSVMIQCDDLEENERLFAALGEGGTVTIALQDTFWGARFGTLTDRFGIQWHFNCVVPK